MSVRRSTLCWLLVALLPTAGLAVESFDIGLTASGTPVRALAITATRRGAPTIVLIGGLGGHGEGSEAVRAAVSGYGTLRARPVNLVAVPEASPDAAELGFPPTGSAYRENAESHVLWRWLGVLSPDLVLTAGGTDAGLGAALRDNAAAGMGRIPTRRWDGDVGALAVLGDTAESEAHRLHDQRAARSPHELPRDHAGHDHALRSYRRLMDALLPHQTRDGLWRNVIDVPGAYAEFSATAMIGYALQRGLREGWIRGKRYGAAADRAWRAVNARSGDDGTFVDVCESTQRMSSVQQYLQRTAILGQDPRGGAMAMLFATERMKVDAR
ncbi:MAG: Unsaturated rhamnogalacturonyl hydrolase YesR [Pseudomonadota bacterium]|jgi:hypothetical protein